MIITVHEYSELFSDAHCPLLLCFSIVPLKIPHSITPSRNDGQDSMVRKWDATKGESFMEKFVVVFVFNVPPTAKVNGKV